MTVASNLPFLKKQWARTQEALHANTSATIRHPSCDIPRALASRASFKTGEGEWGLVGVGCHCSAGADQRTSRIHSAGTEYRQPGPSSHISLSGISAKTMQKMMINPIRKTMKLAVIFREMNVLTVIGYKPVITMKGGA